VIGCSVELATAGLAVGIAGSLIRDPVSNLGSLRQGVCLWKSAASEAMRHLPGPTWFAETLLIRIYRVFLPSLDAKSNFSGCLSLQNRK
jgi:hypothetical protein